MIVKYKQQEGRGGSECVAEPEDAGRGRGTALVRDSSFGNSRSEGQPDRA